MLKIITFLYFIFATSTVYCSQTIIPEQVTFYNGNLKLHGLLYKPKGQGPFPAVLYNHGSFPGMISNQASEILGPLYAERSWVFFMPYRCGQDLNYNISPSQVLSAVMKKSHKPYKITIYTPFGRSNEEGHSFAYLGTATWAPDVFDFLKHHCLNT